MIDVRGKEVVVGDNVAYTDSYYSQIKVRAIVKITPKGVKVQNSDPSKWDKGELFRTSRQFAKVT